jgi:hypothetical protein
VPAWFVAFRSGVVSFACAGYERANERSGVGVVESLLADE